jgi:hypothetical protein
MKNKRLIYVLIPLVLLIWGAIFYRIFIHLDRDNNTPVTNLGTRYLDNKDDVSDSFSLVASYRDPFLSGYQPQNNTITENIEVFTRGKTESPQKESKQDIVIPELKYFGLITNFKNNRKVGLFRLNNKNILLKEGDIQDEFKVVNLFNDSVKIIYRTIKKTFKKNTNQG